VTRHNNKCPPRVAIIGLGRIAWIMEDDLLRVKPCTHVGAYLKQGCELVAACDVDAERRQDFRRRFGVEHTYEDYEIMLAKNTLDVLSICAYATERHAMVMSALKHQVPAIFCEKAFATSLEEADEMVAAISSAGTRVVVGHMRRWSPHYRQVKAVIEKGILGKVQTVNVKFSGSLIHTGTHAFDVLHWWFGMPLAVRGRLERGGPTDKQSGYRYGQYEMDDVGGFGQIFFTDDVVVNIEGRVKNYFIFEFDIIGSEGRVRVGNDGLVYYASQNSERMTGFYELVRTDIPETFETQNLGTVWEAAVTSVLAEGSEKKAIPASAIDARMALEIAVAFFMSDRESGREVSFPLKRCGFRVPSR